MVAPRTRDAFVLRCRDLGEEDRIVVLLSAEDGRIEGVLKRVRRLASRSRAALEPLSRVRVTYRERPGRDLCTLDRMELLSSSFDLLGRPEGLDALSHFAELSEAVTRHGEPNPLLVRLLASVLDVARERLARAAGRLDDPEPETLRRLRLYFDLWLLKLEGFWPDLERCVECGHTLTGPRRAGTETEGALCLGCARGRERRTLPVSGLAAELARRVFCVAPAGLVGLGAAASALRELDALAVALLRAHIEQRLRTLTSP